MRIVRLAFSVVVAVALVGFATPQDIAAQPSLVVGGGISHPIGDMGELLQSGYHGRVGLELGVPVFPVSVRADGAIHRFNRLGTSPGDMTQVNGALSVVLSLGGIGIGPYLLGGVGRYHQGYSDDWNFPDAETLSGYHAGFGVSLGLLGKGVFAEARIVNVSVDQGNARYFPLTVGVRF